MNGHASPLAPWLWSNSLLHSTQTCSGVSYCCDADQVPLSSWCAPLLPRVCQKQSHLWCRIPCLLEAILDHSPHNHLSGLWMALIFLCVTLWQLITHWLVTFLVQHWAVIYLLYILLLSLHLSYLFRFPQSTEHIFGILFLSFPVLCLLVKAAL